MNLLEDVYRLKHIKRYSSVPCILKESVAEHGFFVAIITMTLHSVYDFDLSAAIQIAVCHDLTEIELNDCPHVIKVKYPQIADAYEVCEADVLAKFPENIQDPIKEYIKQKSVAAKVVSLADVIQCVQYAEGEIKLGNTGYMAEVLSASKARIVKLRKELKGYER